MNHRYLQPSTDLLIYPAFYHPKAMEDWRYASMVLDRLQVNIYWISEAKLLSIQNQPHVFSALHFLRGDGPRVVWYREGGTAHILT